MKNLTLLAAVAALGFGLTTSCGDATVKASDALQNMDLSKLSPDAIKAKVPEMLKSMTEKLGGITDLASAKDAVAKLAPTLKSMSSIKETLGANMPDLSALKGTVASLKEKFMGNTAIMDVLKPILDKISALVG